MDQIRSPLCRVRATRQMMQGEARFPRKIHYAHLSIHFLPGRQMLRPIRLHPRPWFLHSWRVRRWLWRSPGHFKTGDFWPEISRSTREMGLAPPLAKKMNPPRSASTEDTLVRGTKRLRRCPLLTSLRFGCGGFQTTVRILSSTGGKTAK